MLEIERNLAELRQKEHRRSDGVSCKHPELDVFEPTIMKFFPPSPALECPGKNKEPWVHVRGDTLVVDQNLVREKGVRCKISGSCKLSSF